MRKRLAYHSAVLLREARNLLAWIVDEWDIFITAFLGQKRHGLRIAWGDDHHVWLAAIGFAQAVIHAIAPL